MQKKERTSFLTGFRLVDYAIVVVCLVILWCLIFPFSGRPKKASDRASCLNNMRQIILACHNYQSSHLRFPSASGAADQNVGASFLVSLLPYLDQQNLDDDFRNGIESDLPSVLMNLSNSRVDLFYCPSEKQESAPTFGGVSQLTAHYYASCGPNSDPDGVGYQFSYDADQNASQAVGLSGLFSPWSSDPADPNIAAVFDHQYGKDFDNIRDGSSNTIALLESSRGENKRHEFEKFRRGWAFGHSTDKDDSSIRFVFAGNSIAHGINADSGSFGWNDQPISSNHSGGAQVAMADGSARFVNQDVSIEVLRAANSIDDREFDQLD